MEKYEATPRQRPKIQKIEILQLTRKNFAVVGITPDLVDQPHPLNEKILLGFLLLTCSIICNLMYTVCEAKTFIEYTQSIYMFSIAALVTLVLMTILSNVTNLFNFTYGLESLVNTSKQQMPCAKMMTNFPNRRI